jgi:tyrosyl-tRNA synthetase
LRAGRRGGSGGCFRRLRAERRCGRRFRLFVFSPDSLSYLNRMTIEEQLAYLTNGCMDVVRLDELRKKLERAEKTGAPLVVKVGFDPTAPDLHLGHTVLIRKMKHFQDLGHTVVYVVGAFTALIGDPTGRSKTRPPLTPEEIAANAETYKTQVFKILDPAKTVVRFNSEWLDPLGSVGWIRLAAKYNVAQMLERREFKARYDAGKPIAVHEFLYPLGQAYDSVFLKADVELGGTDQLFNLNVGRDIMPAFDLEPQVVMTTPLLEGLDGIEKMSKSLGNYVGVTDEPSDMFGKLMSISDDLMWKYYTLLTDLTTEEIAQRRSSVSSGALHPKAAKVELAKRITADFHGSEAADKAAQAFDAHFRKGEFDRAALEVKEWPLPEESQAFRRLLVQLKLAVSGAEADQKLKQGAVKIDGRKIEGPFALQQTHLQRGGDYVLEVGRRAYLLRVT